MNQTMLQLNPPLWVRTPLGEGWAIVMIDYGIDHNPMFLIQLHESSQFRVVDLLDMFCCENPTLKIKGYK